MGPRESVVVEVLGQFRVRVGDRPVTMPQGRRRVVLAVLAMSADRTVSVEYLTDTVWGDDLPANAKRTLQTYVTRLRQVLGTDAITTEPSGYALRTTPDNVDALRFLRLVERAGHEPDVERELLIEALQLWRGDAFEDLEPDRLRETEGRRLAEQRLTAIERRIDLDMADGRAREAIVELRDLTTRFPLREPLWVRLMAALAQTGRQAEALEQYEVVRARIADELGVDPGAELQRVVADLAEGTSPEVTEQPVENDSGPSVPRQLPAAITDFVGRAGALADLDRALADGAGIVAMNGSGGVGKTTLAVQWAHVVADRFPDGQLYLNLRGYGPGNPVTSASALDMMLRGLGVVGGEIPADVQARGSMLRSVLADRNILILLDNARGVEQVRPLLPGSSGPMVLVTSRSQLRGLVVREGARRIGLDQLDPEESMVLLRTALGAGEVDVEPAMLGELADRCGHLPLALAIAAERANRDPALGLDELIGELRTERERLDALDAGGDESIDLRAVFTWSYQALDAETARMFRLLGLYPGPDFGVSAATALAGAAPAKTRRLLDDLVDGNLVQQRRGGRYELHDLIRDYAAELAEQLDTSDRQTALDQLFEWFVHSAANARKALLAKSPLFDVGEPAPVVTPARFDDHQQATSWYDAECSGLLAAVRQAAGLGADRAIFRLVLSAWAFLMRRRMFDEMLEVLPLAEDAADRADDMNVRAQVANLMGMTYGELPDNERSAAYFRQAIELFDRAGDDRGQERALGNLGVSLMNLGRLEDAAAQLERSIEFGRRRRSDEWERVNPFYNLASAYLALGRYDDAADLCLDAIEISRRRMPNSIDLAMSLMTLGEVRAAQDRRTEAIELFRSSIEIFRADDDLWYVGATLTKLGRALRDSGQVSQARETWRQALDLFDELGAPDGRELSRTELVELLASVEPRPGR